jgi:Protein of unknown function (DUF4058)
MRPPFPGMYPWLEHPAIWSDVHNSFITAIRDELAPRVAPKYYAGLEQRTYALQPGELVFVGRPDNVAGRPATADVAYEPAEGEESTAVGMLDVDLPINDRLQVWFLEIHDVETGTLVTVLEILSPANKIHAQGREEYIRKRERIFRSRTNLVEIDLLRAGEPMPLRRKPVRTDYRILISRGATRPRAKLVTFNVRQPIPSIPVPLLPEDGEPDLDLGAVFHALYDRARFDLRLNYAKPPVPPLNKEVVVWARLIVESTRSGSTN